jgi:hypothetical protein
MRSDRVLYFPPPPQPTGKRGRKPKRGAEFAFEVAATQPIPSVTTVTDTTHYGKAVATAWDRLHPLLVRRSAWADHPEGELPVIEAPPSVFRPSTSAGTAVPGLSGCGGRPPLLLLGMWTSSGRRSCADSILSTPSGCSSRRWGGPLPSSESQPPRIAGPGSSLPPTPNFPCPAPRRRPPQPLGAARTPRAPHPGACPSRISPPPRKSAQPASAPKPSTAGPGRPTGVKNKHRAREHPVGKQDKPNLATTITSSKAA